jgi:hypothetical protein
LIGLLTVNCRCVETTVEYIYFDVISAQLWAIPRPDFFNLGIYSKMKAQINEISRTELSAAFDVITRDDRV